MRPASNRREQPADEWVAEFTLSRVFDAPREQMFRIWTDPHYVRLWWGLEGTTNPVCELDVRVGGSWRIDMRMANGTVYRNGGEYLEVVENERLVSSDVPGAALPGGIDGTRRNTVTFADQGTGTLVTLRVQFRSAEAHAFFLQAGMKNGIGQSLERLARLLPTLA